MRCEIEDCNRESRHSFRYCLQCYRAFNIGFNVARETDPRTLLPVAAIDTPPEDTSIPCTGDPNICLHGARKGGNGVGD